MSLWSPTTEGFRIMFRRPSLSLAEISWRWSFGAAACVLLGLSFITYLDTLPVGRSDMLLLRTRQPVLIGQAFAHIFHGSALRVALASVVLFSALAFFWILLASLGRGATLVPLLNYIRERAASFVRDVPANDSAFAASIPQAPASWGIHSLAGLNFLRAALALAAIAGGIGTLIIAGFASTKTHPHPGAVFLVASTLLLILWLIWSTISWFLSVAAIFVVRQGENTFEALASGVDLCRDHLGQVLAVGTWFGLAHLVLFLIASSVVAFPFALVPAVPIGVVFTAVLLLTLAYFALADSLHLGRLAGYIAILESPPTPQPPPLLPPPSTVPVSVFTIAPGSAMVDQSELILSDTPSQVDGSTLESRSVPQPNLPQSKERTDTET